MDNMMWSSHLVPFISCTNCLALASSPAFDDMFLSQVQPRGKPELGRDGCLAFIVSLLTPRFSFTLHSPLQMISRQLVIFLRFIFHLWVCVSMCMPHVCRYLCRTGKCSRSPTAEVEVFMRTVPSLTPVSFWRWLGLYSKCWRISMCTNFPTKNKSH